MKKIAIVGSRNFKEREIISNFMRTLKDVTIVTGGAAGVDTFAEEIAKELKLPCKVFRPDFTMGYNVMEFHKRNKKIAEHADEVHVFWHSPTPGSSSTLRYAASLGKPVYVHEAKPKEKKKDESEIEKFERAMWHVFHCDGK